jgi:CheY-like chemotaxis protein
VGVLPGSWKGRSLPLADNEFAEFLEIAVTDTGIGITPAGLEQLFKPFSQIDGGLARKFEGTGLGLAMVKLLAELHGGAVAVQSAVEEGSCFMVWLPLRAAEQEAAVAAPKAPSSPHVSARPGVATALVVEDDFKSAELVRLQLESEGFKVLHAASAEAALVIALQQPLSLITLDILLPNMDGWELLERIKKVPALTRIPVVIISPSAPRPSCRSPSPGRSSTNRWSSWDSFPYRLAAASRFSSWTTTPRPSSSSPCASWASRAPCSARTAARRPSTPRGAKCQTSSCST